jgi:ABC-2 type transport system ATP-binding protein
VTVDAVIEADGLTKRIRRSTLVSDVSFTVAAGQVMGFLGPNGAGKTTTIRMLLGLCRPTAGQARIRGEVVPGRALARVGSVVDQPGLYPWLPASRNLQLLAPELSERQRIEVLERVGLAAVGSKKARAYSQGMRQRLALAVAIGNGPDAVILDEPANGLDPAGTREFRELLRALADEGRAVLVSSHQLSEVERSCDDIVVLHRGKVVDRGSLAANEGAFDVEVGADDLPRARRLLDDRFSMTEIAGGMRVAARSGREIAQLLQQVDVYPESIRPARACLEERFLALTDDGDL